METKEATKRKYKKHKEGFKIAVDYKLNTALKPTQVGNDVELFPLYVEVRVKRRRKYFPSRISAIVSESTFEAFLNDPFVKILLEEETNNIKKSVLSSIEGYEGDDNEFVNAWYADYKLKVSIYKYEAFIYWVSGLWYTATTLSLENDQKVVKLPESAFSGGDVKRALYLAKIIESTSPNVANEFFRVYEADQYLNYWVSTKELKIYNNNWDGVLNLLDSISISDICSPLLDDILNQLSDNESNSDILRATILTLQKTINDNIDSVTSLIAGKCFSKFF